MTKHRQIGMVGCAHYAPRQHESRSLEEAQYLLVRNVLADAGLTIEDIDGIVVASCDQLDGRAISIMAASGSVGGVGRDIQSTPSCAEHAFALAHLRIRSGQFRTQLILSWSPLETDSISEAQRLGADPYFHRPLPLDDWSAHALQASALESSVPGLRDTAVAITSQNRRNAALAYPEHASGLEEPKLIEQSPLLRWPLRHGMVSQPAFGAVAMILASEDFIAERKLNNPAWIQGVGWATEAGFLGDRKLDELDSLRAAARQAYAQAGVEQPAQAFDLAEVSDATPYQQLLGLEGLGLCARDQWNARVSAGDFAADGKTPVNLSGGAQTFNPVYCAGLLRIAEAGNQIRGRAGAHQRPDVKRTVGHGASGFAMQYNTVVVFGKDRQEATQ